MPPLETLHTRPSWHNGAGRIDRSACVELRASDVHPTVLFPPPRRHNRTKGLETATTATVTARFLSELHDHRVPRHLVGDLRTSKSNVMRRPNQPVRTDKHIRLHEPGPAINPNKGATRTKMLGLWADWSQNIRIERHRLHERLAQHFLICPLCKKKYVKLFMPMCTREEARDADLAEPWINRLDAFFQRTRRAMPADVLHQRAEVIARYGVLFEEGRRLLCRKCIGLRYGALHKPRAATL